MVKKGNLFILFFVTSLAAQSWALDMEIRAAASVDEVQVQVFESVISQYLNSQPSCFATPERLKVFITPESTGATASVEVKGGPDEQITIPTIEVPVKYIASDVILKKSRYMPEANRNAVIFHELGHGIFNASLQLQEIKNIWPELEALIETQANAQARIDDLQNNGKNLKDPEVQKAGQELQKATDEVNSLWTKNPRLAQKYSLYRNNGFLFSALTELMADLITVSYLNQPDIIMQALTPFPKENIVLSAQFRRFTPFNSVQLREILDPTYYSDIPGYLSEIENNKKFSAYRANDVRDAHLVLAPTRVFLWNKYFKGKSEEQRKANLCTIQQIINEQFNLWGAWEKIKPAELNQKIINSFN